MSQPFLGQILSVGFNFAPKHFAMCNGATLSIQQNAALFSLLGVAYGGNGVSTFLLPNLQGRTPVGAGASADHSWQPPVEPPGVAYGAENITLTAAQIPQHTHLMNATSATAQGGAPDTQSEFATTGATKFFAPVGTGSTTILGLTPLGPAGALPHTNIQPYQAITFCIALSGIYPSRN
jgi:microcystin-dependent protein